MTEPSLAAARAHCRALALRHYENFPVGRWGVPQDRRPDIHAVYAFARMADDFADEPRYEGQRLERLQEWGTKLERCPVHAEEPVFIALGDTIRRLNLPLQPFRDLLSAFTQDVTKQRYGTWEEVLDYCRRSANPIGRLVLLVCGQSRDELLPLSDALCTALQLTNFWQDLSVDLPRGRCYISRADADRFGLDLEKLVRGEPTGDLKGLLAELIGRTRELFATAKPLPAKLLRPLRFEIAATWHGGTGILSASEALGVRALSRRPALTGWDKISIGVRALTA